MTRAWPCWPTTPSRRKPAWRHWSAQLGRWAAKAEPQAATWSRPDFDDRDWKTMPAEQFWETNPGLETFDGTIWLRATITLTDKQAKQGATLSLGPIDDLDTTFVNGREVGSSQGWDKPRDYKDRAGRAEGRARTSSPCGPSTPAAAAGPGGRPPRRG
jgi:hypothetical protein